MKSVVLKQEHARVSVLLGFAVLSIPTAHYLIGCVQSVRRAHLIQVIYTHAIDAEIFHRLSENFDLVVALEERS